MILVTLGTQEQKFNRLLDCIENSKITDEIIVQAGGSADYVSKKMKIMAFIEMKEMEKLIDKADIIITHGGTGSVLTPLKKGKKVIAMARLEKYGEHINDHQLELVSLFKEQGYILELNDENNLDDLIEEMKTFKVKKYRSNTQNFIKKIKELIDDSK